MTPNTIEEIQNVMRQQDRFPSPVRAMGSFHSLTPCVSSSGTIVSMAGLTKILNIDAQGMTLTAQAGLQLIDAAEVLRRHNLQFMLNVEIGNITLGSAACCHTKDALDGYPFGQVSSYVTGVKWVNPSGGLEEATEDANPELLSLVRASHGLCGIIYEVTFKIKPLEMVRFDYLPVQIEALTQQLVSSMIASNEGLVCWTVGRTVFIQTRNRTHSLRHHWAARVRRFGWSHLAAFSARSIHQYIPGTGFTNLVADMGFNVLKGSYLFARAINGFSLYDPDKIVDYRRTPRSARYAFSFWAFPSAEWVENLKAYLEFRDEHFAKHGFRCNFVLGSYFIRRDTNSLLSYSYDSDTISIDPIHAPGERDKVAWENYLRKFNQWAHERKGTPLLNQSPFITKEHVVSAYGERWGRMRDWVRTVDPQRRMLNVFFEELLS